MFLAGMEYLGDRNVPDAGRVAFCTYKFANFLKPDPAFMKTGDASQAMEQKGVIGDVDGGSGCQGAERICTHARSYGRGHGENRGGGDSSEPATPLNTRESLRVGVHVEARAGVDAGRERRRKRIVHAKR